MPKRETPAWKPAQRTCNEDAPLARAVAVRVHARAVVGVWPRSHRAYAAAIRVRGRPDVRTGRRQDATEEGANLLHQPVERRQSRGSPRAGGGGCRGGGGREGGRRDEEDEEQGRQGCSFAGGHRHTFPGRRGTTRRKGWRGPK